MERAKLIVKNFGPLKDIAIEVREMVTFIGAQASGKSTLAKLLSIFEDENFRRDDKITFEEELKKYNMFSFLKDNSYILYEHGNKGHIFNFLYLNEKAKKYNDRENIINNYIESFENREDIEKQKEIFNLLVERDFSFSIHKKINENVWNEIKNKIRDKFEGINNSNIKSFIDLYEMTLYEHSIYVKYDSLYISSERNFLHLIAENTLGLINNNVQIPKHLLNSGQDYEKAIQTIKELPLSLIDKNLKYKREGKSSYIYHNETEKIDLLESASGLQSIIPILLLVEYSKSLKDKYNFNFVVEEPELNLYPKAQHELIKYLVKNCLFERKNLILTTHSPFILASINNLLLAFDKGKTKPKEVAKIIKKESWLDPKNFIAYELKNGKAKKIMDDNLGQIKDNMIDAVSDAFSDEFDKLLDL
jgi:predicted ATPase